MDVKSLKVINSGIFGIFSFFFFFSFGMLGHEIEVRNFRVDTLSRNDITRHAQNPCTFRPLRIHLEYFS